MFKGMLNPNPHFRNNGGMDTNFRRYSFWGRLGGQASLMFGWLLPWIPWPIITNACPPKRFQKSLHPKLVAILPGVSEVGYNRKKIYIQASLQLTVSLKHSGGTFFKNLMASFYKFVFPKAMITRLWITVGLKKSTGIIRFTHSLFVILDELIKHKLFL